MLLDFGSLVWTRRRSCHHRHRVGRRSTCRRALRRFGIRPAGRHPGPARRCSSRSLQGAAHGRKPGRAGGAASTVDAPPVAAVAKETPAALAQASIGAWRAIPRAATRRRRWRPGPWTNPRWSANSQRGGADSLRACIATPRIAPESAVCPTCKSQHPFGYAAGLCHVDIVSVSEPARFVEHVVTHFPEHDTPEGIRALAERCAALSFEHQRYLSFIDREQALSVVARLAKHGAIAAVVEERAQVPRSLAIGLAAAAGWHVSPGSSPAHRPYARAAVRILLRQPLDVVHSSSAMRCRRRLVEAGARGITGARPTRRWRDPRPGGAAVGWLVSCVALFRGASCIRTGRRSQFVGAAIGSPRCWSRSSRRGERRCTRAHARSALPGAAVSGEAQGCHRPSRSVARPDHPQHLWMAAAAARWSSRRSCASAH